MLTTIPFSGFYDSLHDSALDSEIESMFSDENGEPLKGLAARASWGCEWHIVHKKYARAYAENFASEFHISSLKFESLNSPREYNFTTDRIFCEISVSDVAGLFLTIDKTIMSEVAAEMFTSRDGLVSFYSPKWETWGDYSTWDHNQVFCLLSAYVKQEKGEFDSWAEFDLMGHEQRNGGLTQMVESGIKDVSRIYKIADYLRMRAER